MAEGRPFTVLVVERRLRAHDCEDMSRKVRLPVCGWQWASAADNGEGMFDHGRITDDEREVIALAVDGLREFVEPPGQPPAHVHEKARELIAELREALPDLAAATEHLSDQSDADAIANARGEADKVHELAQQVAAHLMSWELTATEREWNEREAVKERKGRGPRPH